MKECVSMLFLIREATSEKLGKYLGKLRESPGLFNANLCYCFVAILLLL